VAWQVSPAGIGLTDYAPSGSLVTVYSDVCVLIGQITLPHYGQPIYTVGQDGSIVQTNPIELGDYLPSVDTIESTGCPANVSPSAS
jgi:hypothetical protein